MLSLITDFHLSIVEDSILPRDIQEWFEWITQGCDGLIGEKRRPPSKVDNLADESTGTKVGRQFSVGSNAVHDNVMK